MPISRKSQSVMMVVAASWFIVLRVHAHDRRGGGFHYCQDEWYGRCPVSPLQDEGQWQACFPCDKQRLRIHKHCVWSWLGSTSVSDLLITVLAHGSIALCLLESHSSCRSCLICSPMSLALTGRTILRLLSSMPASLSSLRAVWYHGNGSLMASCQLILCDNMLNLACHWPAKWLYELRHM